MGREPANGKKYSPQKTTRPLSTARLSKTSAGCNSGPGQGPAAHTQASAITPIPADAVSTSVDKLYAKLCDVQFDLGKPSIAAIAGTTRSSGDYSASTRVQAGVRGNTESVAPSKVPVACQAWYCSSRPARVPSNATRRPVDDWVA